MGRRGPRPKGAEHHIMRGNYRPSRHGPRPEPEGVEFPRLVRSWPRLPNEEDDKAPAKPGLTEAQRILLKARPTGMPAKQRELYDHAVKQAWWLEPIDAGILKVWASMTALAHEAGKELDRRLEDPAFPDPKSAVSKEGQAYSRLWYQYTTRAIEAARQLGFTPRSRRQLGIE